MHLTEQHPSVDLVVPLLTADQQRGMCACEEGGRRDIRKGRTHLWRDVREVGWMLFNASFLEGRDVMRCGGRDEAPRHGRGHGGV